MASGIFNSSWILGGFIGPLSSGILVDHYGFGTSASYYGLIQLVNWIIFFIIIDGPKIIQESLI